MFDDSELETIMWRIAELQTEHRDLDQAISLMSERYSRNEIEVRRMKKKKLIIKDAIIRLQSRLIPDWDA